MLRSCGVSRAVTRLALWVTLQALIGPLTHFCYVLFFQALNFTVMCFLLFIFKFPLLKLVQSCFAPHSSAVMSPSISWWIKSLAQFRRSSRFTDARLKMVIREPRQAHVRWWGDGPAGTDVMVPPPIILRAGRADAATVCCSGLLPVRGLNTGAGCKQRLFAMSAPLCGTGRHY